jgi:hypothetical protein
VTVKAGSRHGNHQHPKEVDRERLREREYARVINPTPKENAANANRLCALHHDVARKKEAYKRKRRGNPCVTSCIQHNAVTVRQAKPMLIGQPARVIPAGEQ